MDSFFISGEQVTLSDEEEEKENSGVFVFYRQRGSPMLAFIFVERTLLLQNLLF